jgi:hypothetical protein
MREYYSLSALGAYSSLFDEFSYDEDRQSLIISFRNGGKASYLIPGEMVIDLIRAAKAQSAGKFYNQRIRGKFPPDMHAETVDSLCDMP